MDISSDKFLASAQDTRIRLRTLINLRWIAVMGQTLTLVIASLVLGLRLELGLCFLAVGASALLNLLEMSAFPATKRLNNRAATLSLFFDIGQLALLLFLTGGLNNPFALLFIVPVTVSATALELRSTLFLGAFSLAAITSLSTYYVPLQTETGFILSLPEIFVWGFWASILVGTVFLATYAHRLSQERNAMSQALFATQTALAREQKLTDLGGVVAAYAHEMGTPLATITLVASELADELEDPKQHDLKEDALLIRQEAHRCRDILRSMGRAGKDDQLLRSAPLEAVIKEAAEPHTERGVDIRYSVQSSEGSVEKQPEIWRKPEIIHGLRNLIQNAVDFSHNTVWIDAYWSEARIQLRVIDDGEGFPPELLPRIGDPFLRRKKRSKFEEHRQQYEGMGLGLFIAKTLLERTGAQVDFANGASPQAAQDQKPERGGAIVDVQWEAEDVVPQDEDQTGALGENPLIA